MTVTEIVQQHGAARVCLFLAAVATWLALALVKFPFVFLSRVLTAAQAGLDARVTATVSAPHSHSRRSTNV